MTLRILFEGSKGEREYRKERIFLTYSSQIRFYLALVQFSFIDFCVVSLFDKIIFLGEIEFYNELLAEEMKL